MCLVCDSYKAIVSDLQVTVYEAIKKAISPKWKSKQDA